MRVKHIALSPSSIQLFLSCPQKFIYDKFATYPERVQDPLNMSAADWGTAFHAHLARHYSGEQHVPSGNKFLDDRFHHYVEHYQGETVDIVSVEQTLSRPLEGSTQISLMGTADIITAGGLWDHKTSSTINEKDYDKFANSDQFCHYLYLAGRTSGEVVVNQISQSAYKQLSGKALTDKVFNRLYFTITEEQMADWLTRTLAVSARIVEVIEHNTAWMFRRTSACGDFGGCFNLRACQSRLYAPDDFRSLTDAHFSITLDNCKEN